MSAREDDLPRSECAAGKRHHQGPLARALREPLVHFLIAGLVLFAAYGALQPERFRDDGARRIVLTADDVRRLEIAWAARWQRPPSPAELKALIEAELRQEILYREALALGLGENDTIVKRRLAQKMEFLAEDLSAIGDPSRAELKAWFGRNAERFAFAPRATFRHLYFSPDRRGARASDDATQLLARLRGKPSNLPVAATLGDPFMFQADYADRSYDQLARAFGATFAQSLFSLAPGSWQGPIESGYGWHLVWIDSIELKRIPGFDEVEEEVRRQWIDERRGVMKQKAYEAMRARYEVTLPRSVVREMTTAGRRP